MSLTLASCSPPRLVLFVNAPESAWMRFNMGWSNDKRLFQYFAGRLPVLQKMASTEFSRPAQKNYTTS